MNRQIIPTFLSNPLLSQKRRKALVERQSRFFTPSTRKMRSGKVTQIINNLKALIITPGIDKTQKFKFRQRLDVIRYFDHKPIRIFVAKYTKFVSLTTSVDVSNSIDYIISLYERLVAENGPTYALKIIKDLYGLALRYSTSNSFEPMSYRKVTPSGLPKILGPLEIGLRGEYNERRAVLSVLQLIKIVEHHPTTFSTKTITKKGRVEQIDFDEQPLLGNYITKFIKKYGYIAGNVDLRRFNALYVSVVHEIFPTHFQSKRLSDISTFHDFHVSARNGPNGPSLTTAAIDYCSLMKDDKSKEIWNNIKEFSKIVMNDGLSVLMNDFEVENPTVTHYKGKEPIHSKISLKKESWGRVRPFAILDFFTQSSMSGLHDYLFKFLGSLVEDGTFDQDRVSSIVQGWSITDKPESADLSAATDSIPVEIQAEIMSQIGGREFGRLWMNIVSNREFKTPDGDYIRYAVGQPMGVKTSFAMLAVWHHIVAKTCIRYERLIDNQQTNPMYCIIGDDITLKGEPLFRIYETVVHLVMGVEISKVKGFHNETQHLDNPLIIDGVASLTMTTAELAKRVFCNGYELTPIPSTEVYSSLESVLQFPDIFRSLQTRGYSGYLNASNLTSISNLLSKDNRKLGLTLVFSPLADTPLTDVIQFDPKEDPIISKVVWFTPHYDRYVFDIAFMQLLEGTHARFVTTLVSAFTNWYKRALISEIETAGWKYNSVAQSELLKSVVLRSGQKSEQLQRDFLMNFTNENSLLRLRKDITLFQTMFELGRVFVDPKKARALDRKLFATSYISKVIKQTAVDMRNRAYYS